MISKYVCWLYNEYNSLISWIIIYVVYFSSTHLFLNLHSQSVELDSIWYDIGFSDDSVNIYYALIWDLSVTLC
jgi:hypothetical protein